MVGRYEISNDTMANPNPASTKASTTRPTPSGRTKPKVSSDEPLVTNASPIGSTPVPQKMPVKATMMSVTHTPGSASRPNGA